MRDAVDYVHDRAQGAADLTAPAHPTRLDALVDRLGYAFDRPGAARRGRWRTGRGAPSTPGTESNERLEFLGDAVLGWVVADHVFRRYPDAARGRAGQGPQGVVNAPAAGRGGRPSSTSASSLLLGKGEDAAGGREKPSILADAMEAVIGAVYLDGGVGAARTRSSSDAGRPHRRDGRPPGRARLQDPAAGAGRRPRHWRPRCTRSTDEGPDHAKRFTAVGRRRRPHRRHGARAARRSRPSRRRRPRRPARSPAPDPGRRPADARAASCLSCPRSRPSGATSRPGWSAGASSESRSDGCARCGARRPAPWSTG